MWANFDLFPDGFMDEYWWFDEVGHIVVFGSVAASLIAITQIINRPWYWGVALAIALAIIDEFSQLFISARSFTITDAVMSLVGVGLVTVCWLLIQRVKHRQRARLEEL